MKFELFVALRYLFSKRKQTFISVISAVSILGFTIGVASLVIALSLITGFHSNLQGKILKATSHIMASDFSSEEIKDWPSLMEEIKSLPFVKKVYPQSIFPALASSGFSTTPVVLRGVVKENLPDWLREAPEKGIVLGSRVAIELGVKKGDFINIYLPRPTLTPFGPAVKVKKVKVEGIFSSGLYEMDRTSAAFNLGEAKKVLGFYPGVNYLNIEVDDIYRAEEYASLLNDKFKNLLFVPWTEINRTLFEALKLEKKVLFLTISLIVIVASLNIIASLILLVMEKVKDIGILRSMGVTAKGIGKIFMLQGVIIGFIGVVVGEGLGIAFSLLANKLKLIKVPPDIYQISYVPFVIKASDLIIIALFAMLISFVATLYPARKAAKIDPSEAIRYE